MPPLADKSLAEILATPVQFLKGVGPQRAHLVRKLGLETLRDVLFFLPRDYQDLTDLRSIADLEEGALVSVRGEVVEVDARSFSEGRSVSGVLIREGGMHLRGIWFNQPFMAEKFRYGQIVLFSGRAKKKGITWEMSHPKYRVLEGEGEEATGRLLSVYSLTEGLNQTQIRRIVQAAVEEFSPLLDEVFPAEYLAEHKLWPLVKALPEVHNPTDRASLDQARRRLIYQELLILQLGLAVKRAQQETAKSPELPTNGMIDARIERLFPFELTAAQRQTMREIAADMARPRPMNRLLQGDVGSGKTVVALYAMLVAVANQRQAVLMAPTEVLARQHGETLARYLSASQVRWGVLTGSQTASERAELMGRIGRGEIDVLIGTQAILQPEVELSRLGLVVIDEQHKFGVRQRADLRKAGEAPHYLVMTATPIPRTVALTLYGDLDVSTLAESPQGRQPVRTYHATGEQREKWWEFFRKKLREGRQGYVIAPLVDEAEEIPAASLQEIYEDLANGPLEEFRLGCLHGRMPYADRHAVMDTFRDGRIQVLVATTVVEVGVDVPNATLMTIEGGERFGLSQLHQLRGRIARGSHPGFCCVFAEASTEPAQKRLEAFVATTDGFALAEADFATRGPGELFGTKQHGLPPMRIADFSRDGEILIEARRDAQELVALDPGLARQEHEKLRRMVLARYGASLDLAVVG